MGMFLSLRVKCLPKKKVAKRSYGSNETRLIYKKIHNIGGFFVFNKNKNLFSIFVRILFAKKIRFIVK